jgi:uncharacterized protein DUF6459
VTASPLILPGPNRTEPYPLPDLWVRPSVVDRYRGVPAAMEPGGVVVRLAPRSEPPYDDDPDHRRPGRAPHRHEPAGNEPSGQPDEAGPDEAGPDEAGPDGPRLPPARQWLDHVLVIVLECMEGWRPLAQLRPYASPLVIGGMIARRRRLHSLRTIPRIRSIRVTEPLPGIVEACATVARIGRVQALAVRAEAVADHWRCTAVQLLE